MNKVLVVFGTRPEAVKMAPLVKQLEARRDTFETRVCVTAQHRTMLDQILEAFDIQPHYDLDIMTAGQDLYDITANVLAGIRPVLAEFRPDVVLIQGDTTTSFVTALAAYYEQIDVGHVEAGLRTNNIYSPFPEEMNRQLTTRLAKYHFAPTVLNRDNLLAENVDADRIAVTGNTVIDALLMVVARIESDRARRHRTHPAGWPHGGGPRVGESHGAGHGPSQGELRRWFRQHLRGNPGCGNPAQGREHRVPRAPQPERARAGG
jgi:UDP-N-acetylglucosamine 2-epimerase (non-hydrolysing)